MPDADERTFTGNTSPINIQGVIRIPVRGFFGGEKKKKLEFTDPFKVEQFKFQLKDV